MRTWLVIVLMMLLPLRGWASSAMTVDHAPHPTTVATASETAIPCHSGGPEAILTHASEEYAASHASHGVPVLPDGHAMSSCGLCDVCHSPLIAPSQVVSGASFAPPSSRALSSERFASAVSRLLLKPPKS